VAKKPPEEHDHDHEQGELAEEDLVVLVDVDGNETTYLFIGTVEVDGESFALLVDAEEEGDEENTSVFVFHYAQDEDGGEEFEPVDDDDLLAKVQAAAEKMFDEAEKES